MRAGKFAPSPILLFLGEKKYFQKKLTGKFGDKFKSKIFRQGDKIYQQPNMQVFPGKK